MSKAVVAQCVAGVVSIDGAPVANAVIQSKGVGSSTGFAIMDKDKVWYQGKTYEDLVAMITSLNSMITKISTVLSSVDGALSGSNAATIAALVVENTTFLASKDLLR